MKRKKECKKLMDIEHVRKARKAVWDKFMKRANGNFDKAFDIMKKDAEEIYAKEPGFWK